MVFFFSSASSTMVLALRWAGRGAARLSWDGLPCPNLSTGGYNYHGVREWIPADSLEAMTNVLVTLTESFAE